MMESFQLWVLADDQDALFWGIKSEVEVIAFVQLGIMHFYFLLNDFLLFLPPLQTAHLHFFYLSEIDKAGENG